MLRSRFWLQNQDFGASVRAIDPVFRDLSVPTGPGVPKIEFFYPGPELFPYYFPTLANRLVVRALRHWQAKPIHKTEM